MNIIPLTQEEDYRMRDIKVIEAEIAKLQAELEDVKSYEQKRTSAVHILKNLGWTFSKKNGWRKPTVKATPFDADTMTHVKAGDWVKYAGGYGYVRGVHGKYASVSNVSHATTNGAIVSHKIDTIRTDFMLVVSHAEVIKALTLNN